MEEKARRRTWNAAVGVNVTEVHLPALLQSAVRLSENCGLVFAEIDDTIADDYVNAVGSNTCSLQVLDHALDKRDVALVVPESSGVMLVMCARHLWKKLLLDGCHAWAPAPSAAPPSYLRP